MSLWIAAVLSTRLVSATPGGVSGDADSGMIVHRSLGDTQVNPSGRNIDAYGRLVVFQSAADDLVSGDTNGTLDVFLRDLDGRTTRRISVGSTGSELQGSSYLPSISSNGRFVAFVSDAPDVVSGSTHGYPQVYRCDLRTGTTLRVSVDSGGNAGDYGAGVLFGRTVSQDYLLTGAVSVSDDGRVAFLSRSTNLVPNDTNGNLDVFVHDASTGTTVRASVDSSGVEGNGSSGGLSNQTGSYYTGLSLSGNGRYVAFSSRASNLDPSDADAVPDVFVRDLLAGTTVCVSMNALGQKGNFDSRMPSISYDGRYVAFESYADNLVPGDTNDAVDIFCRDLVAGGIVRVSVDSSGAQARLGGNEPAISGRGRFVAFTSMSRDIVPGDSNGIRDVFVRDLRTGITTRRCPAATGGWDAAYPMTPSLSEGALRVAFMTGVAMTPSDSNGRWDVFVCE